MKLLQACNLHSHCHSPIPSLHIQPLLLQRSSYSSSPLLRLPPSLLRPLHLRARPLSFHGGSFPSVPARCSSSPPPAAPLAPLLSSATSLYPLYVLAGAFLAVLHPAAFSWFVKRGPASYSLVLGTIMLAMGLTLRLEELVSVVLKRPVPLLLGCVYQYTIMPLLGAAVSRAFSLPASLSAGLVLVACCPGGTASNVATYIARGDVPLSVVMTVCTTFGAVFATPMLTQFLAGAYVPVDAAGLALSTLQVVFVPVVVGAWLQTTFPVAVARIIPFAPLAAVLMSSLLACSVFSANVGILGNFVEMTSGSPLSAMQTSSLASVAQAVALLHAGGFLLGYLAAVLSGLRESQRRAISIEVGMQNSSLGVVLATAHFSSPLVAVPAAVSAVILNLMGSGLAVVWRHSGHDDLLDE